MSTQGCIVLRFPYTLSRGKLGFDTGHKPTFKSLRGVLRQAQDELCDACPACTCAQAQVSEVEGYGPPQPPYEGGERGVDNEEEDYSVAPLLAMTIHKYLLLIEHERGF